jgi:iron complex transport system permease protein
VLTLLSAALVAAAVAGLAVGAVDIPPGHVVAVLADRLLGIDTGAAVDPQQAEVLWAIRLPRVVLAVLVGAALGVAGAALQGVFRNPLADPGVVGASAGASLGASLAIVGGVSLFGAMTQPVAAFAGAVAATLLVYLMSRRGGRTEVVTLLLTGLAITAVVEAAVGLLTSAADDQELRDLTFWRLGSLGGGTWETVEMAAPFTLAAVLLLPLGARSLNVLALGEREARHLGVGTERIRAAVIVLAAMGVGAAVAAAGLIAFVGLIVPHLIRVTSGPDHRVVLPASALGGAVLLLAADLLSRTVVAPVELPLGVVTGLLGGPFFLWLLHRTRRAQGGWA